MNRELYTFFTDDHRRIEKLFEEATRDKNRVDLDKYYQFRIGLLTHIKMEEKILFVAAQKPTVESRFPCRQNCDWITVP